MGNEIALSALGKARVEEMGNNIAPWTLVWTVGGAMQNLPERLALGRTEIEQIYKTITPSAPRKAAGEAIQNGPASSEPEKNGRRSNTQHADAFRARY